MFTIPNVWIDGVSSGSELAGSHGGSGIPIPARLARNPEQSYEQRGVAGPGEDASPRGANTFREAIFMMREYYAKPLSDKDLLQNAYDTLSLVVLPQCMEQVPHNEDCPGPAEDCLIRVIQSIGQRCHMDTERLFLIALRGILGGFDANSSLLDQAMMNELKITTAGKFGGVGMVVASRNSDYVVISALDGSPAQKAGIAAGDAILEIDGKPLHGLPLMEVLGMVRGPAGSTMTALVKKNKTGLIREVRLKRRVISIASVKSSILDKSIGYIRIVNFQANTGRDVQRALDKLLGPGPHKIRGLILDLRDNPGGLFDEAIKVAGLFRPAATITSLRGRNPQVNREFVGPSVQSFPAIPMVVLINRGSASASEILAGALQGLPQVLVLGERSFGKASVQAVFPLAGGIALRLTTAHYYTANGRDIEATGIEPDVEIESPEGVTTQGLDFSKPTELANDPEIRAAMDYLLHGRLPSKSPFPTWY